jgi:hypothetical protein
VFSRTAAKSLPIPAASSGITFVVQSEDLGVRALDPSCSTDTFSSVPVDRAREAQLSLTYQYVELER